MNISNRATLTAIALGSGALAAGYALIGMWPIAGLAFTLAAFWYAGLYYEWAWVSGTALVAHWGLAVAGAIYAVGVIWLVVGLVSALAAWELAHFANRMQPYLRNKTLDLIASRHLLRLLAVSVASIVLVTISLGFQLSLPFGWAVVLAILALLGLSQMVSFLRRQG